MSGVFLRFKCPFLRGEIEELMDKHEKIEALVASDVDHWLCNCYFEIIKLPRFLAGQKEYEVELQFTSGLLAFPDRVRTAEESRDGEKALPGSLEDLQSTTGGSGSSAMCVTSNCAFCCLKQVIFIFFCFSQGFEGHSWLGSGPQLCALRRLGRRRQRRVEEEEGESS